MYVCTVNTIVTESIEAFSKCMYVCMYLFVQMFDRSVIHFSGRVDNPFNIRQKALQLPM